MPPNCVGQTSQVLIFPDFKPTEDTMILAPSITILNISEGINSLSNDLEQIHDINMTTMAVHFQSYVNASKIKSVSLSKAVKSINNFKTIKKLNDYIPGTIDFEDPDSVSITASVLSWLVSLFLLMGACGLCIKFCKPCADYVGCLCKTFKLSNKKQVESPRVNFALTDIEKESEPVVNITQNTPPPILAPRLEKRTKLPKLDFSKIRKSRLSASQFSIDTTLTSASRRDMALDSHLQWYIHSDYDRISIRSIYDNEIIIYNWISNNIENLSNVPIQQRFMPPHFNMIFAAINQVTNDITFPKIKLDANNLTCLHDGPDIYYNFTLQKYIRKSNNRVVCGFKLLPDPSKKPETSATVVEIHT